LKTNWPKTMALIIKTYLKKISRVRESSASPPITRCLTSLDFSRSTERNARSKATIKKPRRLLVSLRSSSEKRPSGRKTTFVQHRNRNCKILKPLRRHSSWSFHRHGITI
jgi:hypothetical protein